MVVVVVIATVSAAACSASANRSTPATGSSAPGAPSATAPGGSTPATATAPATAPRATGPRPWWIVGDRLYPGEPRTPGPDPARNLLEALLAGPTPAERAFGAGTAVAGGVSIQSFALGADGIATVSLSRGFETADTRPQVAQVVYTLTELAQVSKVRFLIDGQPNGATGVPPVGRSDIAFPAAG